ncbi:MAG TPA: hypothetical protein VFU74_00155 [Actinocrinis sp.]|nr:hypothetical protein [Actinocrinis sp.]
MLLLDFEIAARFGQLKAKVRNRPGQTEMIEMCRQAARGEQLSFARLFTARRYASRTLMDAALVPFVLWVPAMAVVGYTVSNSFLLLFTTLLFIGLGFVILAMGVTQNFRYTALRRKATAMGVSPTSPQAQDLARSYPPRRLDVWLPTTSIVLICFVIGIADTVSRK